ncbi:Uncharacterised protein [Mycobacteroides abscessus subsp. massiliense]|nr:Uncharacterised protein [Mycobacteroides abscessus subsp. massiliense]
MSDKRLLSVAIKRMNIAALAAGMALVLAGCGLPDLGLEGQGEESKTPPSPTPIIGEEPVNKTGSRYFADWVVLPDGGKVLCVRFDPPATSGSTMSCDWVHAQPGTAKAR